MSATTIVDRRFVVRHAGSLRPAAWYVPIAVAGLVAMRWGVGTRTFIVLGVLTTVTLLPLPAWAWGAAALGVAIVIRAFTTSGILPSVMDFADFGLIYAGLAAVLIRRGTFERREVRRMGAALLLLVAVTWVSWAFNPSDLLRPLFALVLWAEPFAFVLMLVAEPPSPRAQRMLLGWFAFLVALQIPFAIYQWLTIGWSDPVVGTLLAPGGGAHHLAGIGVLASLALTTWAFSRSVGRGIAATVLTSPLLIGLPLVTDAKQVVLSLPLAALVLVVTARGATRKIALLVPSVVTVLVLLLFIPAGQTALTFLEEAGAGRSGKLVGVEVLRDELHGSLSGWLLGVGPANGLSRAAFLTDPTFGREGSPLFLLELKPAPLPPIAVVEATRVAGGTSFNYPLSSAIGVLSDIGLIGIVAFAAVMGSVILPLWRRRRLWLAQTALAGWVMSIPLALTFDWWEQPPFMLTLALLTALALVWIPEGPATVSGTKRWPATAPKAPTRLP